MPEPSSVSRSASKSKRNYNSSKPRSSNADSSSHLQYINEKQQIMEKLNQMQQTYQQFLEKSNSNNGDDFSHIRKDLRKEFGDYSPGYSEERYGKQSQVILNQKSVE